VVIEELAVLEHHKLLWRLIVAPHCELLVPVDRLLDALKQVVLLGVVVLGFNPLAALEAEVRAVEGVGVVVECGLRSVVDLGRY